MFAVVFCRSYNDRGFADAGPNQVADRRKHSRVRAEIVGHPIGAVYVTIHEGRELAAVCFDRKLMNMQSVYRAHAANSNDGNF